MNLRKNESGMAHLAIIGAIAAVFVVGTGATVAANGSKPGDLLYGVDRAAERVQLAFAFTNGMKESAHLSMAAERVTEVKALLEEKDVDANGLSVALSSFADHKAKAAALLGASAAPGKAKSLDDKFKSKETQITEAFASRQAALEQQREDLKKQYEAAVKAGDTELAAKLKSQIDAMETTLKSLETEREDSKQNLEEQDQKIEEHESEADQKQAEQEREAEKKQAEQEKESQQQQQEQESPENSNDD